MQNVCVSQTNVLAHRQTDIFQKLTKSVQESQNVQKLENRKSKFLTKKFFCLISVENIKKNHTSAP